MIRCYWRRYLDAIEDVIWCYLSRYLMQFKALFRCYLRRYLRFFGRLFRVKSMRFLLFNHIKSVSVHSNDVSDEKVCLSHFFSFIWLCIIIFEMIPLYCNHPSILSYHIVCCQVDLCLMGAEGVMENGGIINKVRW